MCESSTKYFQNSRGISHQQRRKIQPYLRFVRITSIFYIKYINILQSEKTHSTKHQNNQRKFIHLFVGVEALFHLNEITMILFQSVSTFHNEVIKRWYILFVCQAWKSHKFLEIIINTKNENRPNKNMLLKIEKNQTRRIYV